MNNQILTSLKRIALYRDRLQDAVIANDPVAGMAHAAELSTISKIVWEQFQKEAALTEDDKL
jgi:hypothetical protein